MRSRTVASLKIKDDKFIRSSSEIEHTAVLMNFFEAEDTTTIYIYETKTGDLVFSDNAPMTFRRKAIYFTKASGVARLEKDKPIADQVIYGDFSENIVKMMRN